jgi:hypothetical protein
MELFLNSKFVSYYTRPSKHSKNRISNVKQHAKKRCLI